MNLPVFEGRRPSQASEACKGVSKGRQPLAGQAGRLLGFQRARALGRLSRRLAPAEQAKLSIAENLFSYLNSLQRDVLSFGRRPKLNTASGHIPAPAFFAARVLVKGNIYCHYLKLGLLELSGKNFNVLESKYCPLRLRYW